MPVNVVLALVDSVLVATLGRSGDGGELVGGGARPRQLRSAVQVAFGGAGTRGRVVPLIFDWNERKAKWYKVCFKATLSFISISISFLLSFLKY